MLVELLTDGRADAAEVPVYARRWAAVGWWSAMLLWLPSAPLLRNGAEASVRWRHGRALQRYRIQSPPCAPAM